jgi:hypothetical protein
MSAANSNEVKKECRWSCEWWAADPDGEYCSHHYALQLSGFGINLNRMLGAACLKPDKPEDDPAWNLCGQERKLWKIRSPDRMPKER